MIKKIISIVFIVLYISVSQFATKAFLTTDAGSGDDFCVTKNLEKHQKQYDCRETKQKIAWTYDSKTDTGSQTRERFDWQLAKLQIIALLETEDSEDMPAGPDPPSRLFSYSKFFVGIIKLTI